MAKSYPCLSGAVTTFLFARTAAGRSLHTIADYRNYLNVFVDYLQDPSLETIGSKEVNGFLEYMQYAYRVKIEWVVNVGVLEHPLSIEVLKRELIPVEFENVPQPA